MSDLDDLVRQRRFDEIHDARRQVIDDERVINEARATGTVSEEEAKKVFQRSVDSYIRELEYLLNPPADPNQDDSEPDRWWHKTEIGAMELPNGATYRVIGLGEYLDMDEVINVKVSKYAKNRYCEVPQQRVRMVTVQPTWELLQNAFRTANAAATDLGMELDISDEQRTTINEELIDEVEKWRRNNLQ